MIGIAVALSVVPAIPADKIFYFSFEINGHKIILFSHILAKKTNWLYF